MRVLRRVEHDHRGGRGARGRRRAAARRGAVGRPFPLEDLVRRFEAARAHRHRRSANSTGSPAAASCRARRRLIGGEPGIGKSTLLIQACAALARRGGRVVYVSGEESTEQVRLRAGAARPRRARRCNWPRRPWSRTSSRRSARATRRNSSSSIRSRRCGATRSNPRPARSARCAAASQALIRFAKSSGAAVILVGHVTKDGQIAGPRVVEHMVDAVMSFEGEGAHAFRVLRASKNRFGATDEIGVFEMTGARARRGRQPLGAVPRRPRRRGAGRGGVRRRRGRAAGAGRNPGAGRALDARHAAARRGRLGCRAGWRWCWRCWRRMAG